MSKADRVPTCLMPHKMDFREEKFSTVFHNPQKYCGKENKKLARKILCAIELLLLFPNDEIRLHYTLPFDLNSAALLEIKHIFQQVIHFFRALHPSRFSA